MYDVTNYSLCVHVQLNIEIPCKDSPVTHLQVKSEFWQLNEVMKFLVWYA